MSKIDLYYEAKDEAFTDVGGGYFSIIAADKHEFEQLQDIPRWFPILCYHLSPNESNRSIQVVGFLIMDDNGNVFTDDFWGDTF